MPDGGQKQLAAANVISRQLEKMIAVFEQVYNTLTETNYIHVQFPKRNYGQNLNLNLWLFSMLLRLESCFGFCSDESLVNELELQMG